MYAVSVVELAYFPNGNQKNIKQLGIVNPKNYAILFLLKTGN